LFNALNAIAGWIRTEPEFADDTVAQLAEVFRYTLHRSQNEWVPMYEEIDFIRAYLAVEHARFGKRLETQVSLSPEANAVSIPSMVIQPLIENAIKHGVSHVGAVGKVTLDARLSGSTLMIEVSDNGPGFPAGFSLEESTAGHGLRNVADRLKGYYGAGASLQWDNGTAGTRVTIKIGSGENG
jgi:two-component system LytT family sensor kinase